MKTQRGKAGWLMLDHRESPGLSEAEIRRKGMGLKEGAGRGLHETNVLHCAHCTKGMVVHPLFMIDLPFCALCDAHICDQCKTAQVVSGRHLPFSKVADLFQEAALKGLPPPLSLERLHG